VRPRVELLEDFPLLRAIVPSGCYLPDFLTPPPATPLPDLKSELASLMATTKDVVRRDLTQAYPGRLPDQLEGIAQDPKAGLRHVADALMAYWECALADRWPFIRDVLAGDITYRAREFAAGGASRLFGDLHPRVTWSGETLVVDREWSLHLNLGGAGMLLIPSAFAWPTILTIDAPELRTTLIYPARGVATLWGDPKHVSVTAGLARLIGGQRAALLASMNAPVTTTELARRMSITAGGASKHLSVLRDAGLVWSSRSGRKVLYARTALGESLAERSA
jgi:DNA-binding transcriptional ArsR family regulator